jgi:transcriptional regulator with XRE-family HTH domain
VFYDKYAQLCKQRGISMSAAAMEAGLSKSLVTKWKANKVEVPSPDVLKKLSAYFNIPVSELLEEGKKEKPTAQGDGLSKEMLELIDELKGLHKDEILMLLQVARSIRKRDR